MEHLDECTADIRRVYELKGPGTFRNPELERIIPRPLTDGRYFVFPQQGEAMHPYNFSPLRARRTGWKAAQHLVEHDPLGPVTHIVMVFTTHRNLEDKPTQMVLASCFNDQGEYKLRLPTQAVGEYHYSPSMDAFTDAAATSSIIGLTMQGL